MLIRHEPKGTFYQGPPILLEPPTDPMVNHKNVPLTNENWRGKNDPTERRRIQNRINQRAFRERKRNGEATKRYHGRSKSIKRESEERSSIGHQAQHEGVQYFPTSGTAYVPPAIPETMFDSGTGLYWDHGARIINETTGAAVLRNAHLLDITYHTLSTHADICTPRPTQGRSDLQEDLWPKEIQYCVPHDPYIDGIPFPQFRENVLRAISSGQVNADEFKLRMRNAGALEPLEHQLMRVGIMHWGTPSLSDGLDQHPLSGWEVSSGFWQRWPFLLEGCDDLLLATNTRRHSRGEPPLAHVWGGEKVEHRML